MKTILDVCYSPAYGQCLDIYLPERESFPVFLYFHGGGLESGDKNNGYAPFISYMTDHGIAVVSANYRMYPDAKYPDFIEDAAVAVKWVFDNMSAYGNVTDVYVGGSSAGGYLSQMLCFDKRWLGVHGISPMDIKGFVHDAGQPTCHFNVLRERGMDTRRVVVDEAAPLYHIGADEKYPPMLFIVSDNDIPCRLEQTDLVLAALGYFDHIENIDCIRMHSSHCAYVRKVDADGESIFGKIVTEYILKK